MDYGYEGDTWLLLKISVPKSAVPGSAVQLKAAASWLVCKEVCIPEDTTLVLPLRVSPAAVPPDAKTLHLFQVARSKLPIPSPWPVRYALGERLALFVAAPQLSNARPVSAVFFPFLPREIRSTAEQALDFRNDGLVLKL